MCYTIAVDIDAFCLFQRYFQKRFILQMLHFIIGHLIFLWHLSYFHILPIVTEKHFWAYLSSYLLLQWCRDFDTELFTWRLLLKCRFRFSPVRELVPIGTPVGTILAAAINQTIFYSIVGGNELGMSYRAQRYRKWWNIRCQIIKLASKMCFPKHC